MGILILVVALVIFGAGLRNHSLSAHLTYTHGKIFDISDHFREGGIRLDYQYNFNGHSMARKFVLKCSARKIESLQKVLHDRDVPLIYDSTNDDNASLILTSQAMNYFQVKGLMSAGDLAIIRQVDSICE
ncbi:MAG TPA: hypothetical protein VKR32_15570 [Puia sp.]|nr:hypothetical protein [Puia sp.]